MTEHLLVNFHLNYLKIELPNLSGGSILLSHHQFYLFAHRLCVNLCIKWFVLMTT